MEKVFNVSYKPYANDVGVLQILVVAPNAKVAKEKVLKSNLVYVAENNSGYVLEVEPVCNLFVLV